MTNGSITHFSWGVFKTMGCKRESFTLRAHDKDISKLVPRSTHVQQRHWLAVIEVHVILEFLGNLKFILEPKKGAFQNS